MSLEHNRVQVVGKRKFECLEKAVDNEVANETPNTVVSQDNQGCEDKREKVDT